LPERKGKELKDYWFRGREKGRRRFGKGRDEGRKRNLCPHYNNAFLFHFHDLPWGKRVMSRRFDWEKTRIEQKKGKGKSFTRSTGSKTSFVADSREGSLSI